MRSYFPEHGNNSRVYDELFPFRFFRRIGTMPTNAGREMNETIENSDQGDKAFFPRGAILFFTLLILFYALLWLVIYGLMIVRSRP